MTKEQAEDFIVKNKINIEDKNSVIVTSDNAVYFDSELNPIEEHCKIHGKTFFVLKGDTEKLQEVVSEEKPKKVKTK